MTDWGLEGDHNWERHDKDDPATTPQRPSGSPADVPAPDDMPNDFRAGYEAAKRHMNARIYRLKAEVNELRTQLEAQ